MSESKVRYLCEGFFPIEAQNVMHAALLFALQIARRRHGPEARSTRGRQRRCGRPDRDRCWGGMGGPGLWCVLAPDALRPSLGTQVVVAGYHLSPITALTQASVAERPVALPPTMEGAMPTNADRLRDLIRDCNSKAERAVGVEMRALWLNVRDSYRLRLRFEKDAVADPVRRPPVP
jgi:hypothetical protein